MLLLGEEAWLWCDFQGAVSAPRRAQVPAHFIGSAHVTPGVVFPLDEWWQFQAGAAAPPFCAQFPKPH